MVAAAGLALAAVGAVLLLRTAGRDRAVLVSAGTMDGGWGSLGTEPASVSNGDDDGGTDDPAGVAKEQVDPRELVRRKRLDHFRKQWDAERPGTARDSAALPLHPERSAFATPAELDAAGVSLNS